jgi:hypothetical protein
VCSAQAAHREAMAAHEETKAILQVRVRVRVRGRVGDMTRQDTTKTQKQNLGKKKGNRTGVVKKYPKKGRSSFLPTYFCSFTFLFVSSHNSISNLPKTFCLYFFGRIGWKSYLLVSFAFFCVRFFIYYSFFWWKFLVSSLLFVVGGQSVL